MLTDATIRKLEAPATGQKLYRDPSVQGLSIRCSQGGTKSFVLRRGKERQLITIGQWPNLTLQVARLEARRLNAEATLGKLRPQSISYNDALSRFLDDKAQNRRPSTVAGYKRLVGLFKFTGKLDQITHEHAARRYNLIKATSEKSHALVAGKVFFNWCIKRRLLTDNPLMGLSKPASIPRKRILTPDEIKALFKCEGTFADYCKLLLLTGQRRSELRLATVTDVLTIDGSVSKNHRTHTVPLTPWAKTLWREWPNFDWSRAKNRLDEQCQVFDWTLHDLRRTARTNWSRLGIARDISERLLNHVSYRDPMEDTYDQHNFLPQMTEALTKWETYVRELCAGSNFSQNR